MLVFATVEVEAFVTEGETAIVMSVPVGNMIDASLELDGFAWSTDIFLAFNIGRENGRFVVGPGLGFSVLSAGSAVGGSFRLPAELGLELLTDDAGFGAKLLARPWAEFGSATGSGSTASANGGGVIGLLVISGFGK